MRTLNVRELRSEIPNLEETLAKEGELLLVSNGKPIARLSAVVPPPRRRLPSLAAFRATMKRVDTPSEVLIREERDRRGS